MHANRRMTHTREDSLKKFQYHYLCNLLGLGMLIYLIWKLWMCPFICCTVAQYTSRGCRVRGQNVELHLKTPGGRQNMIIKYLSVGQGSWFSNQQVALNVLFHMRYDSMPYSKKQPSDNLRAETPPVFTPFKHSFAYCSAQWCPPGVCRHPSPFWSVTLQPLGADQSTIPHMKGDLHSFHMRYISMLCSRRLQRFWLWNSLSESSLVLLWRSNIASHSYR